MALNARPLTDTFAIPWKWDPSLDSERFAAPEEYALAYETAAATLDFSGLVKPGEKPTLFVLKPLRGSVMRELISITDGRADSRTAALGFRLGLVRIDNMDHPDFPKVERSSHREHPQLGPMVKEDVVDFLDALALASGREFGSIVTELGMLVLNRSVLSSPHR